MRTSPEFHQVSAPRRFIFWIYHGRMEKDDHLYEYLEICKRIYERMRRENSWPWNDSTEPDDLIESDHNNDHS